MKLWHLSLLGFTILGVIMGTLMMRDPGYVLISYDGMSLQTSIWIFLFLLILLSISFYYLFRAASIFLSTSEKYSQWRAQTRKNKSSGLTMQGLLLLQEGKYEQAESHLVRGARESDYLAVNFIAAARAANALGESEKREKLLRQAAEAAGEDSKVIMMAKAQMAFDRGDYQVCAESLKNLKAGEHNRTTLNLLQKSYESLGDWTSLSGMLRDITRVMKDNELLIGLQKQIFIGKMAGLDIDLDAGKSEFKKLLKTVKADSQVAGMYIDFLVGKGDDQEAEKVIRGYLKTDWNTELVKIYGQLGPQTLKTRLKTAGSWLKEHEHDRELLNCLGKMEYQAGNMSGAREYFDESLKSGTNRTASEHLGLIYAKEGNLAESNRYLKEATGVELITE